MDFSDFFNATVSFLDTLKPSTLEKLGRFGSGVIGIGQAICAAFAALAIVFGRARWAPPTPAMPNLPIGGVGVLLAIGLSVVWEIGNTATSQTDLWRLSFALLVAGVIFLLIYFFAKSVLVFSCPLLPEAKFVAGLWVKKEARWAMNNEVEKLKPPYVRPDGTSLGVGNGPIDFFCRANMTPNIVWSESSVIASQLLLTVLFWFALTPLPLSLFTAATALQQPDLKVESKSITLPADVLFAFDSDTIRPTAAASLALAAKTIRDKKIVQARIEGHADGRGDATYNRALSQRRAIAVKTWLVEEEGLGKVGFETVGFGAERPVAAETRNGKDDPAGREKNRRVEIQLLR